jgi:hypothetical protein
VIEDILPVGFYS